MTEAYSFNHEKYGLVGTFLKFMFRVFLEYTEPFVT